MKSDMDGTKGRFDTQDLFPEIGAVSECLARGEMSRADLQGCTHYEN
jgi:hypothetical protein